MTTPPAYQGLGQFGPAYRVMFEHDSHAAGSVDRVLQERMVRVCRETLGILYGCAPRPVEYTAGTRPALEQCLAAAGADRDRPENCVAAICRFCADLGRKAPDDLDAVRLGGIEEEIIARGTDWCTDVARVACALCQAAGVPARMVYLANTDAAYSGHSIIEAHRAGVWGAADPTANVIYRRADDMPAATWELMNDPDLIWAHARDTGTSCTSIEQFTAAAVAEYRIADATGYNYAVSGVNDYYRAILDMSQHGWPGGLRWLFGEDRTE